MTIYLYKKTHNKTGLQYLGKTTQDPFTYKGSGIVWKQHLKKHGLDITTEILKECETREEVALWGEYYSQLWNVVESKEWANLTEERGEGGNTGNYKNKGIPLTEEHKKKMRGPRGPISPETRAKRLGKRRGPSPLKGTFKHSPDSIAKMRVPKKAGHSDKLREVSKNRPRSPCAMCGKMYQAQHMGRHMKSHQTTTL